MKHIPSGDTRSTEVLTFAQALEPTCDDFDRDAWIYVPDHYSEYRYLLGTRGRKPLICIGVNPSTVSRTLAAARVRLKRCLRYMSRVFLREEGA